MAATRSAQLATIVGVLLLTGAAGVRPASARGRHGPAVRQPPFAAYRAAYRSFLAPNLTQEWSRTSETPSDEVTLRVWSADGPTRDLFRGPQSDMGVLVASGSVLVRDRERRLWRLESWRTGETITIPFEVASEDNPWVCATPDLNAIVVEDWSSDSQRSFLTFYANRKQVARYDFPTDRSAPHSKMTPDGYVAYQARSSKVASPDASELILFDPRGNALWRAELAGGEGALGPGGMWPAAGGRGILCADYLPDGGDGGSRVFRLFGSDGTPHLPLRFEEATDFRTWVGETTTALFESKYDVAAKGHTLTLANCSEGRVLWQVSQPDVALSTLLTADDPTGKLGCPVIVQAVHQSWREGTRTGYYPPYGLVELRFLRADDGRLINSFEVHSNAEYGRPAQLQRLRDEVWLVAPDYTAKIDLARAVNEGLLGTSP